MADRHHHQHRPQRITVPPRTVAAATSRSYPLYPYPSPALTPTPTPSKQRRSRSISSLTTTTTTKSSFSFIFLLLFSLRSLYSLLPFLRSSPPSFSLFPFSFLVSLLSFFLTLSFSLFPFRQKQLQPILSLSSLSRSQIRLFLSKSGLVTIVFLLRFQALRYCGTAAMILAELSGGIAFRFFVDGLRDWSCKVRGFITLIIELFLLSVSWDRLDCFPLSYNNLDKFGTSWVFGEKCLRIWPLLLPFLSGFLGCYERVSMNWGAIRQLGRKRVRLISLFFATFLLFFPAAVSMLLFQGDGGGVGGISMQNLAWPLANTVLFVVLLNEWYSYDKFLSPKDLEKEFLVTFVCTLVLELVYFPELSPWGLIICGLFLWIAVRQQNAMYSTYVEIGMESSESIITLVMKPIRHILSERKSRKIAVFLMINSGYMVVEFAVGFMSNSLGLISDACHMLFDCAALAIGLYASYISRLPANHQFNYGRGRFEVLSGFANAVFLVLVGALIVLESFERILDPQEISTDCLLAVSMGGLLVNIIGLIFFHDEHHHAHGGGASCSHSHSDSRSHTSHHAHSHVENFAGQVKGSMKCGNHCDDHHDHDNLHIHHDHHHEHDHQHHDHHPHEQNVCCSIHVDSSSSHNSSREGHGDRVPHAPDSCAHTCSSSMHEGQHDHHNHHHEHHHHHHDHDPHGPSCSKQKTPTDGNLRQESRKHHTHLHIDHNMEGIFLHVLADTMGSVGVVLSTLLIKYMGWLVADPVCSIFISVLIVSSVIPLLRNSAEILLQRVPRAHEQDLKEAIGDILRIKGVRNIQNLHVWSLTNTDIVGTVHLHVSKLIDKASAKALVSHKLRNAGVKDLTIQVECVG
ncbi:hypothetical protein Nepgr_022536 [Nepenthes gracilis]|uniref:Cation efflux protein transmembrane domain-containing protein n=1 Tax=Nepenthes gracilis TaxID=150966 RepID=A0AAD3T0Y3_NEPGR|nr:hypothetical protein Nepgr_022536 [Nepenthes gracilis]